MLHSGSEKDPVRIKLKQYTESDGNPGLKVQKFVMSVIEAASGSSCPNSPTFSSPGTRLSQNSQEVIEEALGSLANLIFSSSSSSSPPVAGGGKKSVSPIPRRSPLNPAFPTGSAVKTFKKSVAAPNKKETHHPRPRQNPLLRKKSSLKALTPEDLGRVGKSPTPSNINNDSHFSAHSNNNNKPTQSSSQDHLSTFHLRKPISNYQKHEGEINYRNDSNDEESKGKQTLSENGKSRNENSSEQDAKRNETIYNSTTDDARSPQQPDESFSRRTNCRQCHGHVCIHHYHHHSHHHHHHYYQSEDIESDEVDQGIQMGNQNEGNVMTQNDEVVDFEGKKKQIENDPCRSHHHQDISFYRKFSATSPSTRSKSSFGWNTITTFTGPDTKGTELVSLWSKSKKQKSRSTPIKLDMISEPMSLPSLAQMHYELSNMCGGCFYCSRNELSCNCCCDECCCARQTRQLAKNKSCSRAKVLGTDFEKIATEKEIENGSVEEGPITTIHATTTLATILSTSNIAKLSCGKEIEKFSSVSRSRSFDTFFVGNEYEDLNEDYDIKIDDEILNDPDAFIDAHLLAHLDISSDSCSSSEVDEEARKSNLDTGKEEKENPKEALYKEQKGSHYKQRQFQVHSTSDKMKSSHCHESGYCGHIEDLGQSFNEIALAGDNIDQVLYNPDEVPGNIAGHNDDEAEEDRGENDDVSNDNKNGEIAKLDETLFEKDSSKSQTTNIVIVRKDQATGPTSSSMSGRQKKKKRSGRESSMRIANGEIRSSPTTMMRSVTTIHTRSPSPTGNQQYQHHHYHSSQNLRLDYPELVESPQRRGVSSSTAALMTVTMNSMSLYLDAVHVQMSQE